MVMSAYTKTVLRTVKNNFGRFLAITAIILLGIAFVSGLGSLSPKILNSVNNYFANQKVADIIVKSQSKLGFTSAEIELLSSMGSFEQAQPITALDMEVGGLNARIYSLPIEDDKINKLEILEGRAPQNEKEVLVERKSNVIKKQEIGQKISIFFADIEMDFEIVGIAANPLAFSKEGEPDLINQKPLELIAYMEAKYMVLPLPITDVYLKVANESSVFSKDYRRNIDVCVGEVESSLKGVDIKCLTLQENTGYAMIKSYTEKVNLVCLFFPIFFIAVAALVVLTTMTRLIEEERAAIGCYKTLGYSDTKVTLKYVSFAVICCVIGSVIGMVSGIIVLPAILYPAFKALFFMPAMTGAVYLTWGLLASAAMLLAVVGVTLYLINKELRTSPAMLLKPKAPKAGKKIFLERLTFFWKRLSFRYKSTLRNIFRYFNHLLMTVISVAGATALVVAGFGLSDVSKSEEMSGILGGMSESFAMISAVVIIFAAILCILVLYNLTNMNIAERKREIATLKVLGYHEVEVAGYIYREVLIMALIGIIFGIPLGYLFLNFLFEFMDFGKIGYVHWYTYLISGAIVILFIGIVDLLLHRKIKNVDMTSSLKTLE